MIITGFKLFLVIGIILVIICIFLPVVSRLMELREKSAQLDKRISKAQLDRRYLEKEKERLEYDDFYIEKVARERLGIVKKGEILYKIVPQEIE